ncbi:MAG: EamA family transporter [Desulfovibrionaceae bacterium]|nr:EamA family transporter [Desulfovibrionaceae bacterium]
MNRSEWAKSSYASLLLVLFSEISMTSSASLAKSMFAVLPPTGVTALRLGCAALILAMIFRPWRRGLPAGSWPATIWYGISLACMNLSFYLAIERIPLGVVVGIEIMGPLGVAVLNSRKKMDFLWIGCAVLGLALLLPLRDFAQAIDPVGLLFAVCAGLFWALYIVFGKKSSGQTGPISVSIGIGLGALLILPLGLWEAGSQLFSPVMLAYGFALGIISSALPYSLEMMALRRLPARVFGMLMSLSPALAALSGFLFLGEILSFAQWGGLCCIVAASAGTSLTSHGQ